jgi:hypothetical protein
LLITDPEAQKHTVPDPEHCLSLAAQDAGLFSFFSFKHIGFSFSFFSSLSLVKPGTEFLHVWWSRSPWILSFAGFASRAVISVADQ